jgi:hypothetical protein
MSRDSRIPGFHRLSMPERLRALGERAGIAAA